MRDELTRAIARTIVRCHQLQSDIVTRLCQQDPLDSRRTLEQLEEIAEDLVKLQAYLSEVPPA